MIISLLVLKCLAIAIAANFISREMTDGSKGWFINFLQGALINLLVGGILLNGGLLLLVNVDSGLVGLAICLGIAAWVIGNISGYAWVKVTHKVFAGINRLT